MSLGLIVSLYGETNSSMVETNTTRQDGNITVATKVDTNTTKVDTNTTVADTNTTPSSDANETKTGVMTDFKKRFGTPANTKGESTYDFSGDK